MAQGQVLDGELTVAAEQEGEESKQVEQEKDHRARIVSESAPTDQPLAAGRRFGEGQVLGVVPSTASAFQSGGVPPFEVVSLRGSAKHTVARRNESQ